MNKLSEIKIVKKCFVIITLFLLCVGMSLSFIVLANNISNKSFASADTTTPTTGECGSATYDQRTNGNISASSTKIKFAGKKWDIIGFNNQSGTNKAGVSGPNNTLTILLDGSEFNDSLNTYFSDTQNSLLASNEYSSSLLHDKMVDFYTNFSDTDKSRIVKRNLAGGSGLSVSAGLETGTKAPYNGDAIYGNSVNDQAIWPLSVSEVTKLKESVRSFSFSYWLRNPGQMTNYAAFVHNDGDVFPVGEIVNASQFALRPALYLNLANYMNSTIEGFWFRRSR